MRIFISYSHQQGDWVCRRLVPCLEGGGAVVLIDRERFKLGKAIVGQMDALQDNAERHLLVLSPDYLGSNYCQHETQRALKLDPKFTQGLLLPGTGEARTLPHPFPRQPSAVCQPSGRYPARADGTSRCYGSVVRRV